MTADDVKRVLNILVGVDGGCPHCVASAIDEFVDAFPEHESLARDTYRAWQAGDQATLESIGKEPRARE